jgi:hypothetical protein
VLHAAACGGRWTVWLTVLQNGLRRLGDVDVGLCVRRRAVLHKPSSGHSDALARARLHLPVLAATPRRLNAGAPRLVRRS